MKKIVQVFLGLMLAGAFSSAFAMGYVWILSGGYYDAINYGNPQFKYLLGFDMKKMPDVNSVIRIEAKNRIYFDFNKIQEITKSFKKMNECAEGVGSFSAFMLSLNEGCSIDSVVKRPQDAYTDLSEPIKARVLGYVKFDEGVFVLIEQIERIKEKKDK